MLQVHASLSLPLGTAGGVDVGLSFCPDNDPDNGQELGDDDVSVLDLPLSTGKGEDRNVSHTTHYRITPILRFSLVLFDLLQTLYQLFPTSCG